MSGELHVLFGSGQVGAQLAQLLLDAGKRVRVAKRSAGGVPPGAEAMLGDAADAAFCVQAAQGAAAVYHCMNPPYDARRWAELLPRYMENLIAAAGRASDYFGPGGTLTHIGDPFWRPALAGKTVRVLADPDAIHTYHYIPDVAAGLLTLGCADADAYGRPWMLPCAPAGTLRDLVARFSSRLGREIKLAEAPRWLLQSIGLFVPLVREVNEMKYQWDEPFVINDRQFRERFGRGATDPDAAAAATVAWAQKHYGAAERRT